MTYKGTSDLVSEVSANTKVHQFYFIFRKCRILVSEQGLDILAEEFTVLLSFSILCWSKSKFVLESSLIPRCC